MADRNPDDVHGTETVTDGDGEAPEGPAAAQALAGPAPDTVIADPNCRMVVGQRTASDTALVYLPLGEGAWFAVVNTYGVVFDGTLPFVPHRPVVGKRPDGTILAGFSLEGEVRIVHDGSVIYEFDDVWSFDIADDGSSFFVVEPLAGDASRLVVRNLELREEQHFDLGSAITRTNRSLDIGLAYSLDLAEVIVRPSGSSGTSRFFPVVGGDPREVVVEQEQTTLTKDLSIFGTSELSYHARKVVDETRDRHSPLWKVVKVEREFASGGERSREVWTRNLEFLPNPSMHLSPNGAWLVLSDPVAGVEVLDTADGETVLSYPERRDEPMRPRRFGNRFVIPARQFGARFVGDQLLVSRSLASTGYNGRAGKPAEGLDVDVYKLDQISKRARKVREFTVEPGADETDQSFAIRTSLDSNSPLSCTEHALLDRRLEIRDGRLTYRASG